VREYKAKAKNAQEAHEAIRPTDISRRPEQVARYVGRDEARLYELIWKRTLASQMASADIDQTTAEIGVSGHDGKAYGLRANGSVVTFDGFLKLYDEGRDDRVQTLAKGKDDPAEGEEDDSRRLPPLAAGDHVKDRGVETNQHFTQPPPRYTEATLVKRMEELGIGRPSTYASTLAVLQERDYVRIDKKRLVPEDKGRLVTAFLESFFRRYVEYDFTAGLEEKLDLISDHKLAWKDVLREFWRDFMRQVDETKDLKVSDVLDALNELLGPHIFPDKGDGSNPRICPKCGTGQLSLKISGKSGAFIGCGNYPDCRYTRQLSQTGDDADAAALDGMVLGIDPKTGLEVTLRSGRFGPYLQLGEAIEKGDKPRRSSIPKGWDPAAITLDRALQLLYLPREVGIHPETQTPIMAGLGRFGPFILHDGTYANVESVDEVFDIGLNRAVTLLAEKRAGGGRSRFQRGAAQREVLKDLGEHPGEGGKIEVLNGRYGPYVTHNKVNATIPRGKDPAALTVDEAIALLAERAAKGGGKSKPARGKAKAAKKADAPASKPAKPATKAKPKAAKPAAKKKAAPRKAAAE